MNKDDMGRGGLYLRSMIEILIGGEARRRIEWVMLSPLSLKNLGEACSITRVLPTLETTSIDVAVKGKGTRARVANTQTIKI